jgi:predicted flap endonuclease-1-like 5' DNA nuclease
MQKENSGFGCQIGSWALAAGVGLLVFILLIVIGGWGLIGSIFMAGLAFAVLGLAFSWIFCRDLPAARGAGNIDAASARETSASAPKAAAPKAASPNAPPVSVPPAPIADESTSPAKAAPVGSSASAAAASAPAAPAPAASPKETVQAASAQADAEAGAQVKPSTRLAGQDELAAKKGEWKYESEAKAPAKKAAAKSTPAAEATPDFDGDGKAEGSDEGTKPATLTAAREGGPDNLKEIKGVGPKMEKMLHSMGFFHFDQIANWTADEEAWVNANLEGFKGRVSRDNWVEQAKILASGGETEFSKRVDDGDVY